MNGPMLSCTTTKHTTMISELLHIAWFLDPNFVTHSGESAHLSKPIGTSLTLSHAMQPLVT